MNYEIRISGFLFTSLSLRLCHSVKIEKENEQSQFRSSGKCTCFQTTETYKRNCVHENVSESHRAKVATVSCDTGSETNTISTTDGRVFLAFLGALSLIVKNIVFIVAISL